MALLRGDRAGLPRRLRPRDGPSPLRAGRRAGARLGRVRRVSVLSATPPIIRSSWATRTWSTREAAATGPSTPGARSARAEAMAAMAARFRDRWGFRVFKLKGGVLGPRGRARDLEGDGRAAGPERPAADRPQRALEGRDGDPDRQGDRRLPMEYYEDPVQGQAAMAEVRRATGLKMSTNMCVTSFDAHPRGAAAEADRRPALRPPLFRRLRRLPGAGADLPGGRLDDEPAQQQPRRHHHGGDDPPGRLDSRADPRQRHPLSLAGRGRRHHRGPSCRSGTDEWRFPPAPAWASRSTATSSPAPEVYRKCGMRRRDDGSLMRRIEPGWRGELLAAARGWFASG